MTGKLDKMWTALAAYKNKADAAGHGKSWALMCNEKTKKAAKAASKAADNCVAYKLVSTTASKAAYAAAYSAANAAIYHINNAQGKTK
jgi:hypothetical protein